MTPIKLSDFMEKTSKLPASDVINLTALGLFHAAPRQDGHAILDMRYDPKTGTLVPAP